MTRIVPSRLLSEQAVIEVSRILNGAGATSEAIRNDVGEDLVVQSQIKGQADNFHALFQVKGTEKNFNKNGTLSYPFDTHHLYRWCMHDNPVVVCIFHAPSAQVFHFRPKKLLSAWDLALSTQKTRSILLSTKDLFNEESAKRAIWENRIFFYQKKLSWRDAVRRNSDGFVSEEAMRRIDSETNLIIFNLLRDLGIVLDGALDSQFVLSVLNCARNFAKKNEETPEDTMGLSEVFYLCVLGHLNRQVKLGLDLTVLSASSWMAKGLFQQLHSVEWREITSILKDNGAS